MNKRTRKTGHDGIDLQQARETARSFSLALAVPCRLLDVDGSALFPEDAGQDPCERCNVLFRRAEQCRALHRDGAVQSERLGGRYIYFCSMGMGWIAAPVLLGGRMACSLSCGPIMIMEREDYLASTPLLQERMEPAQESALYAFLRTLPQRRPEDLSHVSELLLAAALYIGDSSLHLLEKRDQEAQYERIGSSLQQYKLAGAPARYPLETEHALISAIREGDEAEARRLLNELLGHIFFSTGSDFSSIRTRSLELMAVLSRAAADGGADLEQVLMRNEAFLRESDRLRSTDDLVVWLTTLITCYTGLVFQNVRVRRKDVVFKAVHYMKQNLSGHVSLSDTARAAGLSPTYFCRVFSAETGCTFHSYLTTLRIERGKALLLSGRMTLREICDAVGYEDQSYFIKVFSRCTGVTPGAYRKKQGRLDRSKERDASCAAFLQKT